MKHDKQTKEPACSYIGVAIPHETHVRASLSITVPIPRLHIAKRAGMPDLLTIHPSPRNVKMDIDTEILAIGTCNGDADIEIRAWYSDSGEAIPNDILDEPEWLNPIIIAATEYFRPLYESNCDPDEWIRMEI